MHISPFLSRSSAAKIFTLLLITHFIFHASANFSPSNPLIRRAESAGSSCSQEGIWNCMTHSFQRCAGGRWSEEMKCSAGTVCSPSGHTDVFKIDYENGKNNGQAPETTSVGFRGSLSRDVAAMVLGLWMACVWFF